MHSVQISCYVDENTFVLYILNTIPFDIIDKCIYWQHAHGLIPAYILNLIKLQSKSRTAVLSHVPLKVIFFFNFSVFNAVFVQLMLCMPKCIISRADAYGDYNDSIHDFK